MSKTQTMGARLRWSLLVAGVICWLVGIFWIFNVYWPHWKIFSGDLESGSGLFGVLGFWWHDEWAYAFSAAGYVGFFLISQWFFLGPRGSFSLRLNQEGRPLKMSVLLAALMAALLTLGVLATLAELCGLWRKIVLEGSAQGDPVPSYWPILLALALLWGIWATVFFLYWRQGDRATQLGRMLRGLLGGSILELLVATPAHVMILRNEDKAKCYCETGSYTALVLGGTVLLWTFGPGIVLLFLREKRRRQVLLVKDPGST